MRRTTHVVTGLGAAVLALALAACSSSGGASGGAPGGASSGASSTASGSGTTSAAGTASASDTSAASTTDYASLLIDAADIPVPGFEKGTPAAPPQGTGTTVAFTGEGGRTVGDTILVLPSPDQASAAAASAVTAAQAGVTGAEVTEVPLGDGGTAIRGTTDAGEVAVIVFSQGTAFVVIEFDSPAGDPVPTDVVQQVATTQAAKIASGLGG